MALLCAWSVIWAAPLGRRARSESSDWLSPDELVLSILVLATAIHTLLEAANSIFVFASPFAVYFSGLVGFLLYAGIGPSRGVVDRTLLPGPRKDPARNPYALGAKAPLD